MIHLVTLTLIAKHDDKLGGFLFEQEVSGIELGDGRAAMFIHVLIVYPRLV